MQLILHKYLPSLLRKVGIVGRPQMKVLTMLFATTPCGYLEKIMIACGKVNFTNLSRYSPLSEKTYRRVFDQRFDFALFNQAVIEAAVPEDSALIAVMDASFIGKSGKKTFGLDLFYNGSHSRVEQGLEVSLVGVVDVQSEVGAQC